MRRGWTINLAFRRNEIAHPMAGFGFVVPGIEGLPLTGCTFSHVKFPGRAPTRIALLRVFVRVDEQSALTIYSDHDWCQLVLPALSRLLGISGRAVFGVINRFMRGLPQYHVGHLDRIEAIGQALQRHPGLVVSGDAYRGHGVTPRVGSAEREAAALCAFIRQRANKRHSRKSHEPTSVRL